MDALNNQTVAGILITIIGMLGMTVIGIGIWFFKQLFSSLKSLISDVTNLTNIVAVLGEKTQNNTDDIRDLKAEVASRPNVKYRK